MTETETELRWVLRINGPDDNTVFATNPQPRAQILELLGQLVALGFLSRGYAIEVMTVLP